MTSRDRPERITPAMLQAGVAALQTYRVEGDDAALVEAVYIAMVRAAERPSEASGSSRAGNHR